MFHSIIYMMRMKETASGKEVAAKSNSNVPKNFNNDYHWMTLHSLIQLQKTIGNQAIQRFVSSNNIHSGISSSNHKEVAIRNIQTKLKVSKPGDVYEQEADRVAEEIQRKSEPVDTQRGRLTGGHRSPIAKRRAQADTSF
jgi:hypothetical protein